MNKPIRTPFCERAKNAPNLEFLTNRMFSEHSLEKDSINNNSSSALYKTPSNNTTFNSVINRPSFAHNSFMKEPSPSAPLPEDNSHIDKKEKNIKKILNTIISLNDNQKGMLEELAEQLDTFGLIIKKKTIKTIQSNILSPYKPLKKPPGISLTLLNSSSKFCSKDNLMQKKDTKNYLTSNNRMFTTNEQIPRYIEKKMNYMEFRLNTLKECNYRCLSRDNYNIYDSCSDNEEEEEKGFLIMRQSVFLFIWNIIMLVAILYYVLILPYCLAFLPYVPLTIKVCEILTEIAYILDIVIQFFIPLFSEITDDYIYNKNKIAMNYLFGWFAFDIITAVPYCTFINYIVYPNEDKIYLTNPIILLKLIKFVKVFKLLMYHNDKYKQESLSMDNLVPSKLKRLITFFFFFMIFTHTLTCLWSFMGTLSYPNWIIRQNLIDKSNIEKYFSAFYFTLATIYSIGYGDIYPTTTYERIYNITLQAIGLFIYSYMITSMKEILKESKKEIKFKLQNDLLEDIKIAYKVDIALYTKLKRYLQHSYKINRDERLMFLESLPSSIKRQLISQIYANLLTFKIFHNTNFDFKTKVILNLKPVCFPRGEIIVKTGNFIEDVVFVKRGVLGIECQYKNQIIQIKKLRLGDHYGEVNMLLDNESEFDLVIKSKHAELLLLSNEKLIGIADEFPTIFAKIKKKSLLVHAEFLQVKKQKAREINLKAIEKSTIALRRILTANYDTDDIVPSKLQQSNPMNFTNDIILEELEEDEADMKSYKSKGLEVFGPEKESNNSIHSQTFKSEATSSPKNQALIMNNKEKNYQDIELNKATKFNQKTPIRYVSQSLTSNNPLNKTKQYFSSSKNLMNLKELAPKRKISSASIQSVQNFQGIQKKSCKMVKKIKEGSMAINNPALFYGKIFEKWHIENQNKRIEKLWDTISSQQFYQHQKDRFQRASALKRKVISSRHLSKLCINDDE